MDVFSTQFYSQGHKKGVGYKDNETYQSCRKVLRHRCHHQSAGPIAYMLSRQKRKSKRGGAKTKLWTTLVDATHHSCIIQDTKRTHTQGEAPNVLPIVGGIKVRYTWPSWL